MKSFLRKGRGVLRMGITSAGCSVSYAAPCSPSCSRSPSIEEGFDSCGAVLAAATIAAAKRVQLNAPQEPRELNR